MADEPKWAALRQDIIKAMDVRRFYEQFVQEKLKVKSDGWSEHVHCPIHKDSGKPNLSVNINTGGFRCFACGAAGSIFDFWSHMNGKDPKLSFREAMVALANSAGINLEQWNKGNSSQQRAPVPVDIPDAAEKAKVYVPAVNKAANADSAKLPIKQSIVNKFCRNLNANHYKYLSYERGLIEETIKRYSIGFDPNSKYKDRDGNWKSGRLTIPILNEKDEIRNIRVYASDAEKGNKMMNTAGYGSPPRLFPLNELVKRNPKSIFFCEGEFDAILLNQYLEVNGFKTWLAVTHTHGCSTFEPEWLAYLEGKDIYFLFDTDQMGKRWSVTHCTNHFLPLLSTGKISGLKNILLPLDGSKEYKDVTDFFVKTRGTIQTLMELVNSTPSIQFGSKATSEDASIEPIEVKDFTVCMMDRKYIDQKVCVPLTVSGESTKLYHATKSFRVQNCPMMGDGCCSESQSIGLIPYGDTMFIESCMANKTQLQKALQSIACSKGKPCVVEEVEKVVMEEYYAHQVVRRLTAEEDEQGRMVNKQELTVAPVYVIQPERHIDIGPTDYMATGYVRSHPTTRAAVLLIERMEQIEEDWSKFDLTNEAIGRLKKIQSFGKVKAILDELTKGVTQIYNGDEILLTILLTYLSPLRIVFNGQTIAGWINSCIIGDSGTGKSATYKRISDWVQIGDLFSALSGSRTGLLYALKQKGVEWYVQIGRYVMASGKIIAVDETQEIEAEEIKKMAIAMKEGWLEVSKVASGGYRTETRTIFLMNPKYGKKISDFPYGCQAITECFDPMFIRRLDLAVFTTGTDEHAFYNKKFDNRAAAEMTLKPDDLRTLIYWAWTRTIHQIHWSDEATQCCLDQATELAGVFGWADDVPLICPQDFRENLARLSTAFAILSGSFTEDYTGVQVLPKHVMVMAKFADTVYSSAACNLRQYSKNSARKKSLHDYDGIAQTFDSIIQKAKHSTDSRISEGHHFLQLVLLFQHQQFIRKRDVMEQIGVSMSWVHKHIAILQMHSLIEPMKGGYHSTRKFNQFLRKWHEDHPEQAELFESIHERLGRLAMMTADPEINDSQEPAYYDPFSQAGF